MTTSSMRHCIGCRQPGARNGLLRFVLAGDPPAVVPDIRRRAHGRGASTHVQYRCVERAVAAGGFQRAFKLNLRPSAPELAGWARGQYWRRVEGLLQAGYRAKGVALGTDQVKRVLNTEAPPLLVVAADAAGRRDELMSVASRLGGRCVIFGDKQRLGGLFGRPQLGVVAVLHDQIADEVRDSVECAAELAEEA